VGLDLNEKKLVVATVLGTLAFCAMFLAQGTTGLVAARLFPAEPTAPVIKKPADGVASTAPGSNPPDIKAILARNIFDSSTGPLWPPPPTDPGPDAESDQEAPVEDYVVDPNNPPPLCEGPIRLIASVYSDTLPEWSFATLSSGSGTPYLYRIGSEIEGNEILAIFPRAVFLRQSSGKPCTVALFSEKPSGTRPTRSVTPTRAPTTRASGISSRSPTAGLSKEELDRGINKVNETQFNIERGLVDKVLQNQAALMRSARIVPHERNGEVVGVKLYGIRRNSLLGNLGLQNGDLLRTINGYDMTSPDKALEAYSKLRSANALSVAVQRRGKPITVTYNIR
jgi:general secretion pathway protein C